jgi:ABC-type branched-subunit amino acid transport system permease subunit
MTLVERLRRLTDGRRTTLAVAAVFVVLALYPVFAPYATYEQGVLLLAFLLALMAVSWNIISGFAGYVSLGHSVFLGLGAYTGGLLAEKYQVNPLWFLPVGGLIAWSCSGPAGTPS